MTLNERQIPVLGIKADRYCTESIADLEKRLNLSEGIESMIRALARSNDQVVVLVDQIDALSQSLSTRRAYLDTFIHLISLLTDIPNIRIVISCRTYDLENDQALSFYRHQKKFVVGKLEETEVKTVIQHLSDKAIDLSPSLLELLKTPLHLDVFCRVYQPNFSTEKITILRDLYDELWRQKITDVLPTADHNISAQQCKMLMFKIAEDMYIQQSLEVPVKSKYAEFTPELKYLQSTGLLYKNQNGLAFFHQTFYDYTFALQFIDSKISIEDYLNENEQSLHIRACLKMMIEFLRDRDQGEYISLYRSILNSTRYYFHIKSLLISLLAAIKQPNRAEIQLAEKIIFPNAGFFKFFIQTLDSSEWLLLLLEQGLLEGLYLPELANDADSSEKRRHSNSMSMLNRVLVRHVPECRNEILEFTWNFPNIESKAWLVRNVLHQLEVWDSPLSFALFDQFHAEDYDVFFADFLKKAISFDLSWTINHIKKAIKEHFSSEYFQSDDEFNYYLVEIIKHGIEIYPDEIFGLLLDEQLSNLEHSTKSNLLSSQSDIISDFSWRIATFDEPYDDQTSLFSLLLYCINEPVIMERSPWSAKYLSWNHFEEMQHYFEQMLAYPKSHENIATILTLNWVHERNDTLKMLKRFIEQSEEARKGVILTAMHNIWDKEGQSNLRSIKLFAQFFSDSTEKVQKAYQIAFRHFQLKDFEILKSILFAFKDSNVAMKTSMSFFDYLSKCATKYPDDCLSLVKDYNRYEKPDINSGEYYSSAPLNVVLNAYHALWGKRKKDSAKIREALLLFDEMLQDDHLSNLAVGVLAKIVE